MTEREASLGRLKSKTVAVVADVLPFISNYAKKFHQDLPDVNNCSFWRHHGMEVSGKYYSGASYVSLLEPTAEIVIIHETLHFLSNKDLGDFHYFGFYFFLVEPVLRRRWLRRGSFLLGEAITERLAIQIFDCYVAQKSKACQEEIFQRVSARRRLRKPRYVYVRSLVDELFSRMSVVLEKPIEKIEKVFYHAYFSHNFCEVMRLTDEAFGAGSFKALISNKNDEINKFERVVKKLCAQ